MPISVADDNGVAYLAAAGSPGLRFRSPDVPIVCPVPSGDLPHIFPAPLTPITTALSGMAFNMYNNIWDTNYIMWYPYTVGDQDFAARFYVDFK